MDATTGIIHSFWCLQKLNGQWIAAQYAWSKLTDSGFGDPAHHYQGARAVGVAPIGGLIRKHEVNDNKANYEHVLSMSLTFSGLGGGGPTNTPAYVHPGTSADEHAWSRNHGQIPEGALVMLPPDFDTSVLVTHQLRKVANTLKKYGARVVDQNDGVPFFIYVEIGSGYNIMGNDPSGWNWPVVEDLHRIREALRMVTGAERWAAGAINGVEATLPAPVPQNTLSMRGTWRLESEPDHKSTNAGGAFYDTWSQSLKFPASAEPIKLINSTSRNISKVSWAELKSGDKVQITAKATGGARLKFIIWGWVDGGNKVVHNISLGDGESRTVTMPPGWWYTFYAESGGGGVPATLSGTMIKV